MGDSDAMLSLAEMVLRGRVAPLNPSETALALITRAAQLGNKAASDELPKIQGVLENQRSKDLTQQQAQELMRTLMSTIFPNVGR